MIIKYIISGIFLYLFVGFLLYLFQRKIVFNTSGIPKKPREYGLNNVEEVKIPTFDGLDLLAWYAKPVTNNPVLVYFHGNSFDIGERAYRIKRYTDSGLGVLLLAWRGYSGNKGKPTEKNIYIDAESSIDWLIKNKNITRKNIIIYGESLGTGAAVQLATKKNFKSIVLEAPLISVPAVAKKRYYIYPVKYLIWDKFDNLSKIDQISSPILIISGKKDEVVPHDHSVKLFDKANYPKENLFIDEAMHNNLYDFGIEKKVINFNLKLWK